jgi:hypothetical protein
MQRERQQQRCSERAVGHALGGYVQLVVVTHVQICAVQQLQQLAARWRGDQPVPARPSGWVGHVCRLARRYEAAQSCGSFPRAHSLMHG